ncbi:helicase-primase complex component [Porcine lymphotropic herpesvirus 3]|uniref:Helicase-primase complex component n=1 Tax=Suid gammaherpesvirus 5 TaxID=1960251 RepID=Q8B3Y1_9GAMA|nr:helicase-primase complex component [Porcine lymphotropic herpesvirus 3]AAO12344.1 helicase-primase complex component [Porcine lymphotropic herpesvirus 3]
MCTTRLHTCIRETFGEAFHMSIEHRIVDISICFIWRDLLWLGFNDYVQTTRHCHSWLETLQLLLNLHCTNTEPEQILHTIMDIMWTAKDSTNFWLLPHSFAGQEPDQGPLPTDCLGTKNMCIFTDSGCCKWNPDWGIPVNLPYRAYSNNLLDFYSILKTEPEDPYHKKVLDCLQQIFYLF